jgi:predicted hydrocarbon binding protein
MNIFEILNLSRTIQMKDGNVYLEEHPISIMSPNMLEKINSKLIESLGLEKASKKIYETSKKGFYDFTVKATKHKRLCNKIEATKYVNKILTSTGWGKFTIIKNSKNKIVVKVENSFMAKEYKKSNYPCDFMIAGFLAGGLSGILSKDFTTKETKCLALGDKFCQFEIQMID